MCDNSNIENCAKIGNHANGSERTHYAPQQEFSCVSEYLQQTLQDEAHVPFSTQLARQAGPLKT